MVQPRVKKKDEENRRSISSPPLYCFHKKVGFVFFWQSHSVNKRLIHTQIESP